MKKENKNWRSKRLTASCFDRAIEENRTSERNLRAKIYKNDTDNVSTLITLACAHHRHISLKYRMKAVLHASMRDERGVEREREDLVL